ncbi:ABC transporter permease [Candidatus Enterococcus ferrettii]|uniref:ABC transporter permease n=1 Tax=Candidatus Enterococcus ferrettii TaxID=2815324 RepID=A0ABV0EMK3_9ENTE|nr:ABC transporter permease [Enterococcus sp. 665A]MBO1339764.1 ABC transporter permease [Enterococcus sp. 665A]
MVNSKQQAIIKKDIQGIVANKRYFYMILLIPLLFSVVLPSVFVLIALLTPVSSNDFQQLLRTLPEQYQQGDLGIQIVQTIFNSVLPMFFLMIPIMTATVMAASSFVGEKEKNTLETLLYSPLSVKQIFQAKVYSSFVVSFGITLSSFVIMLLVVQAEVFFLRSTLLSLSVSWAYILLLLVPAITLVSITVIVKGSAKSQTMEEAQQRSGFLVMPLVLFMVGQFTGLFLISPWAMLIAGVVLMGVAVVLLQNSMQSFTYEMLLK